MKKYLALLACAATGGAVQAQSSVTVYGVLDLSVGVSKSGSGTTLPGGSVSAGPSQRISRMDSGTGYGSRFGFRGTEELGGGLKANFLMEGGIAADTGGQNQGGLLFGRQVYLGLSGEKWSLTAGRQYTPMNVAIASFEPLAGGYWGNLTASLHGAYESIGSTPGSGTFQTGTRADNSLLLTTTSGGFTGRLMVAAGNENPRGTGRFISPSLTYASGPFAATATYARIRTPDSMLATAATPPEWMTQWMLGASYDLNVVKLYAGAFGFEGPQNRANLSPAATLGAAGAAAQAYSWDKLRAYWLGARVPVGTNNVLFQVGRQNFSYTGSPDGQATLLGVAYEHYLSKRTVAFANFGQVINNDRARVPLYGAVTQIGPNGFGADLKALSVGMRHAF